MAKEISLMVFRRATSLREETLIVERARHDADAYALLYRRYLQPVYRYLAQRTGDTSEAEDLTSQVFMEALEGLVHYRDQGRFASWLFTIARRRLIDSYRRNRSQVLIDHPTSDDEQAYEIEERLPLEVENDVLDQVEQKEKLIKIKGLVEALPEDRQEILRLRYAAGLSYEEMATVLKRTPGSIKMIVHRLLEQLQRCWQVAEVAQKDLPEDHGGTSHE